MQPLVPKDCRESRALFGTEDMLIPFYQISHASRADAKKKFTQSHISWSSAILSQLLRSVASSLFNLCDWQPFCMTSVHVLFGLPLDLAPSTLYSIHSSLNHCFLFTAHARIITTCFAVVPRLCLPFPVSFSTLLGTVIFYLNVTHPSAHFSSLPTEVPPHFLQARSHFHATY